MALKDSFINLNKALRTTLQNVPAVVDTLIRGFDEIGDAAEEQSTYSTDERVIGIWIDGSNIYEKVVTLDNAITVPTNEWTDTGVTIEGISQIISINCLWTGSGIAWEMVGARINSESKKIDLISPRPSTNVPVTTMIIRYLKTTANRTSKENDAKNGGDEVPVVKTTEEPAEDLKK